MPMERPHRSRLGRWLAAGVPAVSLMALASATLTTAPVAGAATVHRVPAIAGTFTMAISEDPKTLDPAHMSLAAEDEISAYIGASLVTVDPQGKVVPWLAKSWAFSNGGKTLTFHLRSGVKFQVSGTPLTAQDIVATYDRDLNPATGSPVAKSELNGITSIKADGPLTVVMQLASPDGSVLEDLSDSGYLQPVDPVELKKWGNAYGQHPSSVGPYMLQSWVPGESVTLVRNPAYDWAPPFDHKGAPYLKTLVFDIIPQETSQVAAFASGQVDMLNPVPPQNWDMYASNPSDQFFQSYDGWVFSLYYNLEEPMFQNPLVREALNLSVDRTAIARVVFLGHGSAGWSPYGPNLFGYDKATANAYPYDPTKAKALLRQAGYTYNSQGELLSKGKPVVLGLLNNGIFPELQMAPLVQSYLKAIGIQTKITTYELSTQIANMTAGKYDLSMFQYSWSGADPITLLQILLTSSGGLDESHFNNAAFTALMNRYVASTVTATRLKLAHEIQEAFLKDTPYAPLAYEIGGIAVAKSFKGIVMDPWTGQPLLDNAYVSQ
jgi:peptide/nickel transport system substrate-binding protein